MHHGTGQEFNTLILTKQNVSDTQKLSDVSAPSLTAALDKKTKNQTCPLVDKMDTTRI